MKVIERDWKLFRKLVPEWQEAYMDRLNREYIELLSGDGSASDKFWELKKRINKDKNRPGVILEMKRSNMGWNLRDLILDGVITIEDLSDFSEETRFLVDHLLKLAHWNTGEQEENPELDE